MSETEVQIEMGQDIQVGGHLGWKEGVTLPKLSKVCIK